MATPSAVFRSSLLSFPQLSCTPSKFLAPHFPLLSPHPLRASTYSLLSSHLVDIPAVLSKLTSALQWDNPIGRSSFRAIHKCEAYCLSEHAKRISPMYPAPILFFSLGILGAHGRSGNRPVLEGRVATPQRANGNILPSRSTYGTGSPITR